MQTSALGTHTIIWPRSRTRCSSEHVGPRVRWPLNSCLLLFRSLRSLSNLCSPFFDQCAEWWLARSRSLAVRPWNFRVIQHKFCRTCTTDSWTTELAHSYEPYYSMNFIQSPHIARWTSVQSVRRAFPFADWPERSNNIGENNEKKRTCLKIISLV